MKKILLLVPYPVCKAPSQRFRVEAYFNALDKEGLSYEVQGFLDESGWKVLYEQGNHLGKIFSVCKGYLRRFSILFRLGSYEYVFIHREAAPLGPPVFEWLVAKLWRRKIIFDFDDAIWIPNVTEGNQWAAAVKCFWKVKHICRWSHTVVAGNDFLAGYAKQFNPNTVVIPTAVDVVNRFKGLVNQEQQPVTVGWTGSHSTLPYLNAITPVLNRVIRATGCKAVIICNKPPISKIENSTFIPWREETEIEDLKQIQIGLMPLTPDKWSEGKCGFKIIQYLALGIPAVASPVGVNKKIIDEGENGFLCNTEADWERNLMLLIQDAALRKNMGEKGRRKIETEYSVQANVATFLGLFD